MTNSTQEPKVSNPPPLESTQTMPEEWEKRFDELPFNYHGYTPDEVLKRFIAKELLLAKSQERERCVNLINTKIKDNDKWKKQKDSGFIYCGLCMEEGYCTDEIENDCLIELLESLQKEGEHE